MKNKIIESVFLFFLLIIYFLCLCFIGVLDIIGLIKIGFKRAFKKMEELWK